MMSTYNYWGIVKYILDLVILIIQIGLWSIFGYYFIILLFGRLKSKDSLAIEFAIKIKFAVLIAAHNEEIVIAGIINSLKQVNYPGNMIEIFIVADNCTDNTANIARNLGVKVFERFDPVNKGKGHSLKWMFKKLFELDQRFDAICILDSDNLVSANFFIEMNKQLCLGHQVIQGYLDSKNPHDTWITANNSIAYWIGNRMFQQPRHYLGLNCTLEGTGFVVTPDILQEIGWEALSLTEDLEFAMKLALSGRRVAWAREAVVYDEKPLKLLQSWRQRKRWMQGHCDCARRFVKALLLLAFKNKSLIAFDSALYLLQPFIIVINGIGMLLGFISALWNFFNSTKMFLTVDIVPYILFILGFTSINIIFIIAEGKFSKKIGGYFLTSPIYNLTWLPIIIQGFLNRDRREWLHTTHMRALNINDLEKLEEVG